MNNSYPFDAIVVLGASVWRDEQPSPTLKRRTLHAVAQYKDGLAPIIIGSGGLGRFPPTEAEMIARLCVAEGVPADVVFQEGESTSTIENVYFTSRVLEEHEAKSVLVVSDKYHLPRAIMCFRYLGYECSGSGPKRAKSGTPLWRWIKSYIREIVALPYYYYKLRQF